MDILIIAPSTQLSYQADELKIVLKSDYRVTPLTGTVTIRTLVLALDRHYDIIWFAGHSDEDGLSLSDGNLPVSEFAPLVKNSRLILLNSCESVGIAARLRDATSVDVIAHIGEVEDRFAFRFGATFIKNLKQYGENFKRAFDESITGNDSDYVFLRAGRWANMVDDLTRIMFELKNEIASLKTEIALATQRIGMLEASIKNIPNRTPDESILKLIAVSLVVIAILVGYGVYVSAK